MDQKTEPLPPFPEVAESEAPRNAAPRPGVEGFPEIFQQHARFLWRTLMNLGVPSHEAQDLCQEVMLTVDRQLGAVARPRAVHFVTLLPKTRSGKTLRRAIQALAEGRDPGDLTTIEDPGALDQIRNALQRT